MGKKKLDPKTLDELMEKAGIKDEEKSKMRTHNEALDVAPAKSHGSAAATMPAIDEL